MNKRAISLGLGFLVLLSILGIILLLNKEEKPDNSKINTTEMNGELKDNSFIKSANVSMFGADEKTVIENVDYMGLNTVTVPVKVVIDNVSSNNATIQDLDWSINLANTLKERGINVIIEPYPYINQGTEVETNLLPTDPNLFFENWGKVVTELAKLSEENGYYGLYVGSSFAKLEELENSETLFGKLIENTRKDFTGKIIYRTNWWYDADWEGLPETRLSKKINTQFYKQVDILAIAAYFEISETDIMDVDSLSKAFTQTTIHNRNQNVIKDIEDLQKAINKPIMFGELGISNKVGSMGKPYDYNVNQTDNMNENIQAIWLESWITTMSKYEWFKGYSIFSIGEKTSNFYPNESAQTVIKNLD